jgi:precorrin-2 dehydrogenase / sirohydrochlorin ferrochelatase
MANYYPIFVDMQSTPVLVVGGGTVARRKIETLLEHGADVSVVSRKLHPALEIFLAQGKVRLLGSEFAPSQLDGIRMVIAATDDKETNSNVSAAARERGLLVNAVDQPADCTFIVPAIVRRGALTIAVSTSGNSPALASKIRKQMEQSFGWEYENYLNILGRVRRYLLQLDLIPEESGKIFHDLVEGRLLDAVRAGDMRRVEEELRRVLPSDIDIKTLCAPITRSSDSTGKFSEY